MKKVLMSLAAVAAVFAGCQKPELEVAPVEVMDSFTATVENFDATKTAMDGNHVVWSSGDQLAIFQGAGVADLYELANGYEGLASGAFTLKAGMGDDFYGGMEMTDPRNVAFYPYAEGLAAYSEDEAWGVSNVTLPATQVYAENSFANGAFAMVAVTESLEDHVLRFKNVLGAVKLQFKGSSVVKSVALKGNNNEVIAGAATVIAHDGFETPSVVMAEDGATEVVLDCGEGVQVSKEGTNFVFALPPVKFEKGFTVTVTYADESTYTVEAAAANEVLRSGVLVMPEVTLPSLTFSSVSSMTDAELNVALEGYTGFYGMFLMPGMWENVKMYIEYGYFGFSDVLAGAMGQELPCYLYEGQTYTGKLTEFGIAPEYFEYDMYNWIQPNTTYTLGIVPVVEGKVEYTVEDVKLFEVSTNSFSYGANLALPEVTVEEGYNETLLSFAGSEEVTYVKYEIFKVEDGQVLPNTDWTTGEPIEFPTEDNYIDAVTYEAEYDAETGFQIYVSNDYGVEPGAEYKLCVMLVNAEGKTSLHKMDVKTLPIPYNNDLQVSFAGALEYDDLTNSVDAVVNVPAEAVKLYYTFMNTRYWDAKQISSAVVSIVDGSTGWEFVDLTDATQVVDGQVSFNFEVGNMNKYGAAKVGVHVVAVDTNGKVSQYVTSELSVDKYVPAE
jgi:hypothetical protein